MKKFDFAIGNPPYQQDSRGANENDTPVYHIFYDAAIEVAEKVELISPARFLFNAGGTPKAWNQKMLNDSHLKVKKYFANASEVFANTDIKGGVAITYHDSDKDYEPISIFTKYEELNEIKRKVGSLSGHSLSEIVSNRGSYRYSEEAFSDEPEELSKTADRRIAPSAFERMPKIFLQEKPLGSDSYIQILGNLHGERVYRWMKAEYLSPVSTLKKYKLLVSKANGNGQFGEALSAPVVCSPNVGFTETYIAIGSSDDKDEVKAIEKYIKSKFARTLLGILKVTQNISKDTWKYVPLQDFTESSDIDWSRSIPEIDQQLYRKYGLTQEEIDFIETHVKEMV